jgi:hypothetical protein
MLLGMRVLVKAEQASQAGEGWTMCSVVDGGAGALRRIRDAV